MAWVYILECADGAFYTGSTVDLERRLVQHNDGEGANSTRKRLPVKIVFVAETDNVEEAFGWEKRIQGWSRAKKLALIEGRWTDLPGLSRRRTPQRG
jgi:putative endonuclease